MELAQFRATLAQSAPPDGMSLALQTLWWDAKGDWDKAHGCAQQDEGSTSAQWDGISLHPLLVNHRHPP